jgi:hypothetical protein
LRQVIDSYRVHKIIVDSAGDVRQNFGGRHFVGVADAEIYLSHSDPAAAFGLACDHACLFLLGQLRNF